MKIGVISDTHDQIEQILKAVDYLNQEQVELVVHCGDWVSPFTLRFYAKLRCPIKSVFGNNDGDKFRHLQFAKTLELSVAYEDRFLTLEMDNRKIAVWHGDYKEITDSLVLCGQYDAVFHGHTHARVNEHHGKTLSLNPGTLMPLTTEQIKGASIAIYDTVSNSARFIDIV